MILNDATSWSITLESSIMLLESSFMLLENIYCTDVMHDDHNMLNRPLVIFHIVLLLSYLYSHKRNKVGHLL
jgi:hypothetical protein